MGILFMQPVNNRGVSTPVVHPCLLKESLSESLISLGTALHGLFMNSKLDLQCVFIKLGSVWQLCIKGNADRTRMLTHNQHKLHTIEASWKQWTNLLTVATKSTANKNFK